MTFTIGRASFTRAPSAIRHFGDFVDVNIDILPTSLVEAKVLRQQILGLAGNDDERVVPLTWSDDADYDGFYRVRGVDVEPVQAYLTNNLMRAAMSLERIGGGYAEPVHEVYVLGVDASDADLSSTNGWTGSIANTAAVYFPSSFTVIGDLASSIGRSVADGTTINELTSAINDNGSWSVGVTHLADAADFYDAAAVIERQISSTWYTVVGRQIPQDSTVRLSNGIVRVSVASSGEITTEHWDGSAWRSKSYTITYNSGSGTISGFGQVQIFRNGPDTVAARFTGVTSADEACHIDVNVQRGHNVAEFRVSTYSQQTWKVTRSSTEAATAINDASAAATAIRASSNDGNGDRFVLSGRETITADTTNGGITFGATSLPGNLAGGNFPGAASSSFGIGLEINGSSATGRNTANALSADYQVAMFLDRSISA